MTAAALLREAAALLHDAGVPSPEWDAERLLRHVTGWDRAFVVARPEAPVGADAEARFRALLVRRAARVPLQHLVGTQAFWRHEFLVTPDVLIPRPETEVLVEACLDELRGRVAPRIVDVGTGSGCIAVSLALERPDAEVHAVDGSAAALDVARENARRLGAGRVELHEGDLLGPVAGLFDLVASNPPYVDASEIAGLQPEVRDHEPLQALVPPGGDRYAVYARLVPDAARALRPAGSLVLEIGQGMEGEVTRICQAAGLLPARVLADLQGIHRTLVARRSDFPAGSLPE
jgi:release factor glutamine methyltransferase